MTKIIMNYMDDRSLFRLLKTNTYFRSFLQYDTLWKERTLKFFGRSHIKKVIDCDFYRGMAKKAIVYEIPLNVYDGDIHDLDQTELEEIFGPVLDYLRVKEYHINFGDLVHLEAAGDYMNNGKFIYDGQKLIELDGEEEAGYGDLPSIFYLLTPNRDRIFSLDYWSEALDGNRDVWLHTKALGAISFTIQYNKGKSYVQCIFELDQFYTLIDYVSIVDELTVDVERLEMVKKLILHSENLAVNWRCPDKDLLSSIDFSRVCGIPLYIDFDAI